MMRLIVLSVMALLLLVPAARGELPVSPLSIRTGEAEHSFTVEIARTPEAIQQGLMFRQSLAENAGMLFDFGGVREASMWMKNTLMPLDMLFIDANGQIVAIARNTVPGSLRSVSPGVPVRAVLEIPAGRAKALGIKPGDTVVHTLFGNTGG